VASLEFGEVSASKSRKQGGCQGVVLRWEGMREEVAASTTSRHRYSTIVTAVLQRLLYTPDGTLCTHCTNHGCQPALTGCSHTAAATAHLATRHQPIKRGTFPIETPRTSPNHSSRTKSRQHPSLATTGIPSRECSSRFPYRALSTGHLDGGCTGKSPGCRKAQVARLRLCRLRPTTRFAAIVAIRRLLVGDSLGGSKASAPFRIEGRILGSGRMDGL
jgi:hypothetical protein